MITREFLEKALDDAKPFQKQMDYGVEIVKMLRDRIPYEEVKSIIGYASHEQIYLVDVDIAIKYITEEDVLLLADGNCFIDTENDSLSLFT